MTRVARDSQAKELLAREPGRSPAGAETATHIFHA